jgi:hypothetical protein
MVGAVQAPIISLQQSMSGDVTGWSGIKQASCGATPKLTSTPKTNSRDGNDIVKVYIARTSAIALPALLPVL